MTIYSMTGYGRGNAPLEDGSEVVVEVRTVNHRFLDTRLRLSSALNEHAASVERVLRRRLTRGHIELSARLEGESAGAIRLDKARARGALASLVELRDELGLQEPVPLSLLAAVPDLFGRAQPADREALGKALECAAEAACDEVAAMREAEGDALARDLAQRAGRIRELASDIGPRCADLPAQYRSKLQSRIERLLSGGGVSVDAARVELEVAIMADKIDVAEELTRLQSHAAQALSLLASGGAVGRKLEFLLQELSREVNTIGSKVPDLQVTDTVLSLKAELERMREQVQNLV